MTDGFTAVSPIQENKQGSKQSVLEILGARLVKNELLDSEPQEEDLRVDFSDDESHEKQIETGHV